MGLTGVRGAPARPRRDYRTGPVTRAIGVATWVLVAVGLAVLAVRYPDLPQTVPTHFDAAGRADDFGDRSSLFWLALVWVVLQAGITWLAAHPHVGNFPVEVTHENAQRLYREAERLLVRCGAALAGTFGGILGLVMTGAEGWSVLISGSLVVMLGSCVVAVVRMLR